ncbi:ABC transporter permease [Streptomyces sp. NPDC004610]|uniref:ABC transporter permease n=1 Tax=unclassified Streptomyces TaxID=2593676 RepID=UPI0033B3B28D
MTHLMKPPADSEAAPAPAGPATDPPRTPPRLRRALLAPLRSPGVTLSVLVLALVLGWTLVPDWFAARDPLTGTPAERFLPPSTEHLFGTDQLGRDVYTRVVHGASLSLRATVVALLIALVGGVLLGLVAGFFGHWADTVVMRVVEVMLSVPPVLLSLTIITALGVGTAQVAIAVGITGVAGSARLMRAEVLRVRTAPYVEAAILCGTRWWRLLPRHILPAAIAPVLALAVLDFGLVVLAISSLSFLGYGEPPPAPEWGALVAEGRNYLATSWWLTTLPSLTVTAVVLAANRLSRVLEKTERRNR